MNRETKVPAIPAVTKDNVVEVLQAIKDTLEVREGKRGDELDQVATFRDLVALELVNTGGSVSRVGAGGIGTLPVVPPGWGDNSYNPETDFSIPPSPTNLIARPGISDVLLFWDNATYKNHAYTEIWRSDTDNLADAVKIATTSTFSYSDAVTEGRTYYYWVRFVSSANVTGPYNQTSGTIAITELNPERLLNLLTGQITASQLYQDLGARIDLIDDPVDGLVRKVDDLEDIVGEVAGGAQYAAEAAASAAAAVQAKTDALLAQTGAQTARDQAIAAQTSAQTSAAGASTSATQASQSATGAAGSASSANQSATTATNAANAAGGSAAAASTSASNAATYATNAETASTASQSAKVAAESARDAASSSATAASQSASTATTKATEAGQSANAASTSATNAATSAGNAATSASQASSSATNAQGSASSASNSATAAANSATSAQNSATAAATSASTATTKATEAENSASAATAAKVSAESARDSATTSASAAATSASTATTKASEASQSATSASQSATQASTNAANALTYRNDAASSASTATTKASEASTSAGAAATSAANASNSASAASNSAQTATTKATEAGASATAASTSATNAATSAGNALVYQNNAAQSSVNAQGYANSAATASTSAANSLAQLQATATGFDSALAWNFDNDREEWSTSTGSLSHSNGVIRISSSGSGQILRSSPTISITGKNNTLIRARVKRISGSGWQGTAFYTTSAHGEVLGYRKVISNTTVLNEWRVLEWDMSTLNEGGNDWVNSTITGIRLDLGASFSDVFDIDWIAVGRVAPQAYTAAIAQEATVRAQSDGALFAQYTVKVDTNGYVSGFGLASETPVNGTPSSNFAVRADRFYIASPTGPGIAPAMPFIVQTTPTTINGEAVPVGVYIDTAYIRKGTITSAYIGDLSANKITAGTISAAVTMTTPTIKSGVNASYGSTGFFLGYDSSTPKFYVGNGSTKYIKWDGTNAEIGGGIYAQYGQIGNINIVNSGLSSTNYIAGSTGWWINGNGAAEFSGVTVRGTVHATSGTFRNITIYDNNNNVILSSGGTLIATETRTGNSRNLLANGSFRDGLIGCLAGYNNTGVYTALGRNIAPEYTLSGEGTAYLWAQGTPPPNTVFDATLGNYNSEGWSTFPCLGGDRVEAFAYINAHRCQGYANIAWLDSSGNYISEIAGNLVNPASASNNLRDLSNFVRSGVIATAPSNARFFSLFIRGLANGSANPFVFFSRAFLGFAGANQTEFSAWSDGTGVMQITQANASTYIESAAIDRVFIKDAAINSAKIADAEVGTLKIAGEAVTVPRYAEWSGTFTVTPTRTGDTAVVYYEVPAGSGQARVLFNAVVTIYPIGSSGPITFIAELWNDGQYLTETGATIREDGFSNPLVCSVVVNEGWHYASIRFRTGGGSRYASYIVKLFTMAAKR